MLRIKELSKRYRISKKKTFTALNRVSFDIENEKMIAIIGESGSGKSTLMNLIATIDKPNGGYIEYNGKKVTFNSENKKARFRSENIGFVFQSFNLLKDLTAKENVEIVMEIAGVSKKERSKRAQELLNIVGLDGLYNKKPGTLSGGQKQRVAIARALANDPEVILADEPTGSLDHKTSLEIMKLLSTIAASGKKILVVTHDLKVASYCERIITMEDGEVISDVKNQGERLETIDIPKPIKGSLRGLKFAGIVKLSIESFKRKFKRNLLISVGTAVAIASLLLVSVATTSIKNYLTEVESLYGNPNIIKLTGYSFNISSVVESSDETITKEDIESIVPINDFKGIKRRVEYNSSMDMQSFLYTTQDGMTVNQTVMYPDGIDTFGKDDLLTGVAPKSKNEIAISPSIVESLGYNNTSVLNQKISLVVNKNYLSDLYYESDPNNLVDSKIELEGEDEPLPDISIEEFVVSAVLTDSSIRMFNDTVYFTYEYANSMQEGLSFTNIYEEIIVLEPGKTDDFIDYIGEYELEMISKGIFVQGVKDLEIIMMLSLILDGVFIVFTILLGVSIIVAAIMIAIMSYVSILERIREVGVLRSVGAKRLDIIKMFMHESATIGLLSGIIASILGVSLAALAINIVNSQLDSTVLDITISLHVNFMAIVITIVGAILLSIISSILSITLGLRISPAEALRRK